MYVCMHVSMYACMCVCYACLCMYVCYACLCMYVCMYVCMCVCVLLMYEWINVFMYVCMYVRMYVCIRTHIHVYVCMYICMYVRMYYITAVKHLTYGGCGWAALKPKQAIERPTARRYHQALPMPVVFVHSLSAMRFSFKTCPYWQQGLWNWNHYEL
jgi:hypothetical protein